MVLAEEDYADDGDSKLLQLIKAKDWASVVLALLKTAEGQRMVAVPDVYDNLPLHVIIGYQGPDELILRILEMHPTATKVHGTDEWLPLHVAAMWGVSSKVMEALIREHPMGLDDKGEEGVKGRTPRHFALRWPHNRQLLERSTSDWMQLIEADRRKDDFHPLLESTQRMKASSSYGTLLLNSELNNFLS